MAKKKPTLLVALGGNALIRKGQEGTVAEQFENLRVPMGQVALLADRYRLIITHGNGPQVGNLLLQQESCDAVPRLPLEILVAQTQGQIGYMIESTLDTELMKLGRDGKHLFVSLLSYVVVDELDPAFQHPEKPVGPAYSEEKAGRMQFPTRKTAKGWRRVVASPKPVTIVEKSEIKALMNRGFIVICCGGGGIPVIREGRGFAGVDAVIDKDLASARLAEEVGVDLFLIATDEPGVFLDYGTPRQRHIDRLTLDGARKYLKQGQFPPGTMGPKIRAAVEFTGNTGRDTMITSIDAITGAVQGKAGTVIVCDPTGAPPKR